MDDLMTLATFGASWALLHVSHSLADHVTGQCDWQAAGKGAPTADQVEEGAHPHRGWLANLAHVGQYHVTVVIIGFVAWLVLPLDWSALGITCALLWSAITHAFLDRRWPVRWYLTHTGSKKFASLAAHGMNGMYLADQAFHSLALLISAVMLAVI